MALHLQDELEAVRTALKGVTTHVYMAGTLPNSGNWPTDNPIVIMDIVSVAAENSFGGYVGADLQLQVDVFHPDGVAAALGLFQSLHAAMKARNYNVAPGFFNGVDEGTGHYRIAWTYELGGAFDDIT